MKKQIKQVGPLPVRVGDTGVGVPDFSGQKGRDAGQGVGNADVPTIIRSDAYERGGGDNEPQRDAGSTVFQSSDPKLHTDASFVSGDGRVDGTPGRGGYPVL